MKFRSLALIVSLLALSIGFAACGDMGPANNGRNASNVNKATPTPAATPSNSNKWNSNISKEDYEKDKAGYEKNKSTTEVVGDGINDSWLWFKVRSALMMADDLRESTVSVSISNEVVTLAGTVANAAQKASAEKIAKGITGVKSVKNDIKVAAGDSITNQMVNGNTKSGTNTNKK